MPTKAPTLLTCFSLLIGASMMTACSNSGITGPQAAPASASAAKIAPKARSESGYVVAERDSSGAIGDGLLQQTATTLTEATSPLTQTIKKKLF